jgi:hypothetical protein
MEKDTILQQFKEKVCEKISLEEKGIGKYLVKTPFIFEDGDNLTIILQYDKEKKKWKLTDESHTFLHISYFMDVKDLSQGTREELINNSKKMFGVQEKGGELFLYVENNKFGDALYDFIQALMKIIDVTYLERQRVSTTFFNDFKSNISEIVKARKLKAVFEYNVGKDKTKTHPIDCIIESEKMKKPIFVFALDSDTKVREATISLLMFEKWNIKFHSVGVFENQQEITRKVVAHFSAVCEKQIPSLDDVDRFAKFIDSYST